MDRTFWKPLIFVLMFILQDFALAEPSRSISCENELLTNFVKNKSVKPQMMMLLDREQDVLNPDNGPDPIVWESFDDEDFAERGWFDGNFGVVDPTGRKGVSGGNCLKWGMEKRRCVSHRINSGCQEKFQTNRRDISQGPCFF